MTNAIQKLIADDSWAATFQTLRQYRSALLVALAEAPTTTPKTDDEILEFLENQPLQIEGDLERSRDGKLCWVIDQEIDATDAVLYLARYAAGSSTGSIPQPIKVRFFQGNKLQIEACNRKCTHFVIVKYEGSYYNRQNERFLSKNGIWEPNTGNYEVFLEKFSWPTVQEARQALEDFFPPSPVPLTYGQQAARITELETQLRAAHANHLNS